MTVRIDAAGTVRFGKAPTQAYTLIWRNVKTGETVTETRTETLKALKNYIFGMSMNYNFSGSGKVLEGEIWRTYKNQSKRVY